MTAADGSAGGAARARAWRDAVHASVCDSRTAWEHGAVVRASRYPSYHDFNLVQVEDDPGIDVGALIDYAETALAGLDHGRIDFDLIEVAEPLRADFEGRGWVAGRLLWMRHEQTPPRYSDQPQLEVVEVDYGAVDHLRLAWAVDEHPDQDPTDYLEQAREVALLRGVQVLAAKTGEACVAYAQLEHDGGSAEITQVYVGAEHRGAGLGTALTPAAISAAGEVADLWILADDEGRAKDLYRRLGFRPVWTTMEFTLWP